MIKLCELLDISVNELLAGEKITPNDYNKKAEENMMNLIEETERTRKEQRKTSMVVIVALLVTILTFLFCVVTTMGGAKIGSFIDAPQLLVIVVPNIVFLAATKLVIPFGKSFLLAIGKESNIVKDDVRKSLSAVKLVGRTSFLTGLLYSLITLIAILYSYGDGVLHLEVFFANLQVGCLGILYALIINLLLLPVMIRLECLE